VGRALHLALHAVKLAGFDTDRDGAGENRDDSQEGQHRPRLVLTQPMPAAARGPNDARCVLHHGSLSINGRPNRAEYEFDAKLEEYVLRLGNRCEFCQPADTIYVRANALMSAGAINTVIRVGRMNTISGTVMSAGIRAPFSSALEARVCRNSWLRMRNEAASG